MPKSTDSFNLPAPRGGSSSGESYSYRGSELTKSQVREIKSQNEAAKSLKTTDLDAVERGKAGAQTRKLNQEQREDYAHSVGEKKGLIKGAAAGATAVAPIAIVAGAVAQKVVDKSTQSGNVRHRDYRKPVDK